MSVLSFYLVLFFSINFKCHGRIFGIRYSWKFSVVRYIADICQWQQIAYLCIIELTYRLTVSRTVEVFAKGWDKMLRRDNKHSGERSQPARCNCRATSLCLHAYVDLAATAATGKCARNLAIANRSRSTLSNTTVGKIANIWRPTVVLA